MQESSRCHFHCALGCTTPVLAQMLDSLVRVSRRDGKKKTISSPSPTSNAIFFRYKSTMGTTPAAAPQLQAVGEVRFGWHWFPSLPFQQVQVLFDSAFARLCIFPSRYLYAIGLSPVFSLGWNLPPVRAAIPNNSTHEPILAHVDGRESHPLSCPIPGDLVHELNEKATTIRHQ